MNLSNNIQIQFDCESDDTIDPERLENLVRNICTDFGAGDAFVQINVVDDSKMIELHRQFLHQNGPTDVMSFDLSDDFEPGQHFEIIVNLEAAKRAAGKRGHRAESELALYVTHGMLHQLGYDDQDAEEARKMHTTEDAILQRNGFGVIYYKETETED